MRRGRDIGGQADGFDLKRATCECIRGWKASSEGGGKYAASNGTVQQSHTASRTALRRISESFVSLETADNNHRGCAAVQRWIHCLVVMEPVPSFSFTYLRIRSDSGILMERIV